MTTLIADCECHNPTRFDKRSTWWVSHVPSQVNLNRGKGMVRLTETALAQARLLQQQNAQWRGKGLRLWISGKNCEGLLYGVTFDAPEPEDHIVIQSGVAVLIDPDTTRYVEGSSIDFVDDERGKGFLVENPNSRNYAGKFYLKRDP